MLYKTDATEKPQPASIAPAFAPHCLLLYNLSFREDLRTSSHSLGGYMSATLRTTNDAYLFVKNDSATNLWNAVSASDSKCHAHLSSGWDHLRRGCRLG